MDFRLTEEQRLVRDTARDFVDRELITHVREWEQKGEVPRSFYRKMAGLGFLGAPVPEKYGGAGRESGSFFVPRLGERPGPSPLPPAGALPACLGGHNPDAVCLLGAAGEGVTRPPA